MAWRWNSRARRAERLGGRSPACYNPVVNSSASAITVRVNGRPQTLPVGATVADLVRALDLATPLLAVERNREVVPRARHAEVLLADGDALEIVQFVGGG